MKKFVVFVVAALSVACGISIPPIPGPQPPGPGPIGPQRVAVTVLDAERKTIPALDCELVPDDSVAVKCDYSSGIQAVFSVPSNRMGWGGQLTLSAKGFKPYTSRVLIQSDISEVTLSKSSTARTGVVQTPGRLWTDAGGPWYPFGSTLFWALYGWQHDDQARVLQHVEWFAKHRVDYIRILGQVNWDGEVISPDTPAYSADLGSLIDAVYDRGLRTQITVFGGGYAGDPFTVAQKVADVVNARPEKVFAVEVVNEWWSKNFPKSQVEELSRFLAARIPVPVTTSATLDIEELKQMVAAGNGRFGAVHLDRSQGDNGWRLVRQSWDVKEYRFSVSQNEPGGPGSSVASYTDPLILKMARAVGIMNGAGAYVLHTGSGVYGRAMQGSTGFRPANVWEIPNIDAIFDAVASAADGLPLDLPNWSHVNSTSAFPFDFTGGDMNKHYAAVAGNRFVSMPSGVTGGALLPRRAGHIKIIDGETGWVLYDKDYEAGAPIQLPGDPGGHAAYIAVGEWR